MLHKKNEKLFSICPAPLPPGQNRFKQFPTPGPKGWTCPGGCPGGMVTGKIEPCIKRQALPYPEILARQIEICRKNSFGHRTTAKKTTYYLVRHMRGTPSELGLMHSVCHSGGGSIYKNDRMYCFVLRVCLKNRK